MNTLITINDSMSLDEKLKAIDEAIANNQANPIWIDGEQQAPVDPASLVMCDGCQ